MGEERVDLERESESEVCGRVVAMDTPKRNQITSPISKFEDSPVFNYINNLSPIQPVKSVHVTQTFNSLSFASLPSVFTSPHVSSLKESRFLRRHHSDPSKPEFSSEVGNKVHTKEGIIDNARNFVDQQENFDPGSSAGVVSVEQSHECSKLSVELSRSLSYDCNPATSSGIETKCMSEAADTLAPLVQEVSETGSFGSEVHIEAIHQIDQNIEAEGCDWENLIFDAADVLNFDSPNETEPLKGRNEESVEPGMRFCTSLANEFPKTQPVGAVGSSEIHDTENPSTQPGEAGDLQETVENQDIFACISLENCIAVEPSEKMDDEVASSLDRGKRRRCLVFEMVGARRKHFDDGSSSGCSMLSESHGKAASNDQRIVPFKPANDPSRRILPGIGLHLNALATSMDQKVVKHETSASGGLIISVPRSTASFHSLTIGQEPSNKFIVASSLERETGSAENGVTVVEDATHASGYVGNEELNQSSPRKKRRRSEHGGESEACKRCNCKKSKCLKLYCECFAAGVYCVEPCSCQDCFNKPIHEDTVLATRKQIESRNPLAFAPKVIRSSDSILEIGDESIKNTPASARHKRGCNCKKSGCLKKYCECYQGGVGCSINCRCEGCKNAFGRKDGSTEAEEEEEIDECERAVVDRALSKNIINDTEHNTDFSIPATPLQFGRPSIQMPFSSKSKPPRSSCLATGSSSSSGLYSSHRFGKPSLIQPQAKFEKHFQTVRSDEMPEILQGGGSPVTGVKSSSPNSKRVSPPHCNIDSSSPGQRSSRKLILRSIPSFPSLADPKH